MLPWSAIADVCKDSLFIRSWTGSSCRLRPETSTHINNWDHVSFTKPAAGSPWGNCSLRGLLHPSQRHAPSGPQQHREQAENGESKFKYYVMHYIYFTTRLTMNKLPTIFFSINIVTFLAWLSNAVTIPTTSDTKLSRVWLTINKVWFRLVIGFIRHNT
jgi:hypothetical protein